jgi:periplasmic protein CpxP/Spy
MKLTRIKILSIAVVVLVLLNITTIASIWPYIDLGNFTFSPPSPQTPREFIIDKLNLDAEQQRVFEALRQEHFEEMKQLQVQIAEEKQAMYNQLRSDVPDTSATYNHISSLMQKEERLEHITMEHFRKVRAICNDEQKQHFDVIIDKVMKMVIRPQHEHHRATPEASLPSPLP